MRCVGCLVVVLLWTAGCEEAPGDEGRGGGAPEASTGGGPGGGGAATGTSGDDGGASADAAQDTGAGGRDGGGGLPSDAGQGDATGIPVDIPSGTCEGLPAVTDYDAPGPFDVAVFQNVGPSGNYTLFRADASFGQGGFRHPIAVWGNGISTTPDHYTSTLTHIASHGFVVIACNDVQAERPCLSDGLDWLVQQNEAGGELAGKLDIEREVTIGYSWGGGAAIDTADRPHVRATASLHGMPPREDDAFASMHAPLLLFTSTGDSFVNAEEYVTPNYEASQVQTFYATLQDDSAAHLYPVDPGSFACLASISLGSCEGAVAEQGPTVAWLRLWACDDANAREYFYGDDCELCSGEWTAQRKMWQ